MEITGKIIAVLPLQSGEGRNGQWRSQDFVVETNDQYPKKACINLFNDRIDKFPIAINDNVTVSFDIEAREYNGRWYNTVRAWNIKKNDNAAPVDHIPSPDITLAPSSAMGTFNSDSSDDDNSNLPF